ncbi:uncharacterized protein IL334_001495 [Kwoniella shivajii]|uniref:Uncharacterized protein n=1 Tax=Kwoniella shivajii TaxID=564305 RepID=A0ABZ1CS98_9TREE|nr:hypothetical protein IL334_001495 [Kwoniella shivajii]
MVADPFSAASKPFIPPDSFPSRPLPFAATLDDPSSSSIVHKLPKPKLHKEGVPSSFPSPIYSHSRQASSASISTTAGQLAAGLDLLGLSSPGAGKVRDIGSDEWMMEMVAKCVDAAKGDLIITGHGLINLSTKISELRDLVTLPSSSSPKPRLSHGPHHSPSMNLRYPADLSLSPGANHLSANARSFTRSTSAPASSSSFFNTLHQSAYSRTPSGLGAIVQSPGSPTTTEASEDAEDRRAFGTPIANGNGRALLGSPSLPTPPPTGLASPSLSEQRKRSFGRSKTGAVNLIQGKAMDIGIYAGQNSLTSLPSALFEISNLTVLSLRGNKLTSLPAAIGELRHLKELNVGLNHLTELPSTILHLNLDLFTASPNDFPKRPSHEERFSDIILNYDHPVTRLTTICMNILISTRPPNDLPPLLDMFEWDHPKRGVPHPLLDSEAMHEVIPSHSVSDLGRVLQTLRTASTTYKHRKTSGGRRSLDSSVDPFPRPYKPLPPDDASTNPYFYPCPSPRHLEMNLDTTSRPTRHLFLHPAEERIEWREVCGTKDLPIKWRGCSPGCLDFLEKDEEEEWTMDSEEDW